MNKYTILYLFALIALAYAQSSTKSIPADAGNDSSETQETQAKSAPKATKLSPSEYFASKGITTSLEANVAKPTKALPTKIVQTNSAPAATAASATVTPVKAGNNTAANATSDAVKVTGTLLAAIVAAVMALY